MTKCPSTILQADRQTDKKECPNLSVAFALGSIQEDKVLELFQGAVEHIVSADNQLTEGAEPLSGLRQVCFRYTQTVHVLNTYKARSTTV